MKRLTLFSLILLSVIIFASCDIFSTTEGTVEALIPVTLIDSITNDSEYIYFTYIYTKPTPCWKELEYVNEVDGNFINVKVPGVASAKTCSPVNLSYIKPDSIPVAGLPAEVTFRFFRTENTWLDSTYTIQ
jgi:hypothetical protein